MIAVLHALRAAALGSRRARAATAAALLAALLAGCGSSGVVEGGNNAFSATTLTVYTDLPFLGPNGAIATSIAHGEELALYEAGGRVNRFHVSIQEQGDTADAQVAAPVTDVSAQQAANAAHAAASDLSTIAFIGDLDSAATSVSLPLNNENGILQISPGSSYSGFTDDSAVAAPGGASVWSPNGHPSFARLVPTDVLEARAMVAYMRSLGVKRLDIVSDDERPRYDSAIGPLVAADLRGGGAIATAGVHADVATASASSSAYAALAAQVAGEHPDAVLLAAAPGTGAAALMRALHAKLPRAKLFASSALAMPAFLDSLGAAAGSTYATSPVLEPDQYPAAAQAVFARYRALYPGSKPTSWVLYGYEAMEDVLAAIRKAGRLAAQRQALLSAFRSLGRRDGVLGAYTFDARGDISLHRFDGYRVGAGGALVFVRGLS